jgi:membrane protein
LAPEWRCCTFDGMTRALEKFRLALLASLSHDVFGSAKAAAYSAILCLFPTILVLTTLLALTPESDTLRGEMRAAFAEVLPSDTMNLLHAYFTNQKIRSEQVVFSAILVSLFAAMGMMLSLMEGFRRAYELPRREWSFWVERLVAIVMVPLCLVPLAFATIMVAFGHQIEEWVVSNSYHVLGPYVLFVWRLVRWTIGLITTICVLAVIYQFGTPRRREWKYVLPGASGAAITWFLATLAFGFYLTRFADYSVVYGPLGAVVATLVWLYISTVSVLIGAEFNAHIYPKPPAAPPQSSTTETPEMITAGHADAS